MFVKTGCLVEWGIQSLSHGIMVIITGHTCREGDRYTHGDTHIYIDTHMHYTHTHIFAITVSWQQTYLRPYKVLQIDYLSE